MSRGLRSTASTFPVFNSPGLNTRRLLSYDRAHTFVAVGFRAQVKMEMIVRYVDIPMNAIEKHWTLLKNTYLISFNIQSLSEA
jgi:hypothetical protein